MSATNEDSLECFAVLFSIVGQCLEKKGTKVCNLSTVYIVYNAFVFTIITHIFVSLVPRLSMGGWRRAWYTLIADPPTFHVVSCHNVSQCVIMIF